MKLVVISIIAAGLSFHHSHCDVCDSCSSEVDESGYDSVHYRGDNSKHKHKKHSSRTKLTDATSKEREALRYRRKPKKYDCVCDCQKCSNMQKCCQPVCGNECDRSEERGENSVETEPGEVGQGPGNLVFVPYPYPLVVPPLPPPLIPGMPFPVPAPPAATTTAKSLVVTGRYYRRSDLHDDEVLDLLRSLKRKEESPQYSMRPLKGRQTQDYEQLDDQLLDQLIRQRQVKDINS